jgi:accessory gene regulator protein AgrB
MLMGIAFILSKTVPIMPNKVCRFVFLFVLWVPLNFVFNYLNVWAFGYHKMSRTAAIIIALLIATFQTFVPPEPTTQTRHNLP